MDARREALKHLVENGDVLPLDERKERLSVVLPLAEGENEFLEEVARIRQMINAQILPVTRIEDPAEGEETQ